MLRFLGFKASVNFNSGKTSGIEHYDKSPGLYLNGAYRLNKDDLFGSDLYSETPKKITPSMVNLPTKQPTSSTNQSKSTSNLTKPSNETKNIRKSAPDIPQATNQPTKVNIKEQKKLEKQRLAEQKKQEKIAEKERQRGERLRKEREKQLIAQQTVAQNRSKKEEQKKPKKRIAPQPQPQSQLQQQQTAPQIQQKRTSHQPQQQLTTPQTQQQRTAPLPQQKQMPQIPSKSPPQSKQSTTNTLESSISKSSGPPPYSSDPEVAPNRSDHTGNTSFVSPVEDMDSWGLISQHRQQMNRQAGVSKSAPKQKHLDLHYNVGNSSKEKSKP